MIAWPTHLRHILVHLGEDVSIVHGSGAPVTVTGLFLSPAQVSEIGIGSVQGSNPHIAFMTADFSVAVDDIVTRNGVQYKVRVKQPDDPSGITVCELRRTS